MFACRTTSPRLITSSPETSTPTACGFADTVQGFCPTFDRRHLSKITGHLWSPHTHNCIHKNSHSYVHCPFSRFISPILSPALPRIAVVFPILSLLIVLLGSFWTHIILDSFVHLLRKYPRTLFFVLFVYRSSFRWSKCCKEWFPKSLQACAFNYPFPALFCLFFYFLFILLLLLPHGPSLTINVGDRKSVV